MIIPATDTPGAIGAGVPAFMRDMLTDWGIDRNRAPSIASVLEAIEQRAWSQIRRRRFSNCRRSAASSVMRAFDADARRGATTRRYRKFK